MAPEKRRGYEAAYVENKDAIDNALEQCTGHRRKLKSAFVEEAIRRLQDYYHKHGTGKPSKRPVL